MAGIIQYWQYPYDIDYIQKLHTIVDKSNSVPVKVVARYHLAQWYTENQFYGKAVEQLNALDLNHQIYTTHKKYGDSIKRMRSLADKFSAGNTMPDFETVMLSGNTLTNTDLKNKVAFLYFYGSACGQCISMYPKIADIYNKYDKDEVRIIGIAYDWQFEWDPDNKQQFKKYAEKFNIFWPQAVEQKLWNKLQIQAFSTGYLIDQDGKIARISRSDTVSNAIEGFEQTTLEEAVVKLLDK